MINVNFTTNQLAVTHMKVERQTAVRHKTIWSRRALQLPVTSASDTKNYAKVCSKIIDADLQWDLLCCKR